MKENFNKIAASPLFHKIGRDDLQVMLECMGANVKKYHKGEIVILSSAQVQYVGVVLDGCIHMVKEQTNGEQVLLTIIRSGELFGESFVCLEGSTSYTTFLTSEKTTVLFIPFQKIMYMCDNRCPFHHMLIENMVGMLSNKNVRLMQKIDISSRKTLREKLLAYFQMEQKRQKAEQIELDINRATLADYLGVNRSALTRELSKMKEEGLIDFEKNIFSLK